MRYTPFDVDLHEITETHVAKLQEVPEGRFVEYKSEPPSPRQLAKSLAAFANREGGWLFLGIQEDPADHTAASFPGLPGAEVASTLEQLRNATKDLLQPTVPFFHHTLKGPLTNISLPPGHSIVIIQIPESAYPPHVHNDGRIYVRTADSSSPISAADSRTIDLLHQKAEQKIFLLEALVDRSPQISQGEESTTYLHLTLCSDPFRVLDHWFSGSFADFSAAMSGPPLPFDNIYTTQDGFVARQALNHERYKRLLTWEFSKTCNSFITYPLETLEVPSGFQDGSIHALGVWSRYDCGERFASLLVDKGLWSAKVLDLNMLVAIIGGIILRHRSLARLAGVKGPFQLRARMENTWRVVPFIDTSRYISHIEDFDVPIVQDTDLRVPSLRWPEGFITLPELDQAPELHEEVGNPWAIMAWIAIVEALGIPGEVLSESANVLLNVAQREIERHRSQLPTVSRRADRL